MKRLLPVLMVFGVFLGSAGESFAVDLDHVFTIDSITSKPVRSDYSSEAAFAADSLVYGIPRICSWHTTENRPQDATSDFFGQKLRQTVAVFRREATEFDGGTSFMLGANLRKSSYDKWYAISASNLETHPFRSFVYVNGNTGDIACGEENLKSIGGSWTDGKWYKTFELVLKTKGKTDTATGSVGNIVAKAVPEKPKPAKQGAKASLGSTTPTITPAQTKDTTPPAIQIASAIQVKEDSPTISGRASDNEKVVQVTVEGRTIDISSSGRFSFKRYVPVDGTQVTIEAIDEWGNKSTKVVKLTREAVQTAAINRFDALDPTNFSAKRNANAVALIIGIADYKRTAKAKYADRDAKFFSDYARRKLGVPRSNIKVLTNGAAGLIELLEVVTDWLPGATTAGRSDVYVFFAGHGLGSENGKEVYLLPHNSSPRLLDQTAIHRSKFFDTIASAKPRSVTVFLDTCYSGTSRNEEVLLAQRGIVIVPKKQNIPGNFTVFSAAGMKQTAKMLDEAKHGLFSYYLMKGMEGDADSNKDRKITSGELHKYVLSNVSRLQRNQTPELQGDVKRVLVQW